MRTCAGDLRHRPCAPCRCGFGEQPRKRARHRRLGNLSHSDVADLPHSRLHLSLVRVGDGSSPRTVFDKRVDGQPSMQTRGICGLHASPGPLSTPKSIARGRSRRHGRVPLAPEDRVDRRTVPGRAPHTTADGGGTRTGVGYGGSLKRWPPDDGDHGDLPRRSGIIDITIVPSFPGPLAPYNRGGRPVGRAHPSRPAAEEETSA